MLEREGAPANTTIIAGYFVTSKQTFVSYQPAEPLTLG